MARTKIDKKQADFIKWAKENNQSLPQGYIDVIKGVKPKEKQWSQGGNAIENEGVAINNGGKPTLPLQSTPKYHAYQKQSAADLKKIKDELWADPVRRKKWAESQLREEIRASKSAPSEASRVRHAGSLSERARLYAELDDEVISRIEMEEGIKQVPKTQAQPNTEAGSKLVAGKGKIYKKNIDTKTKIGVTPTRTRLKVGTRHKTPIRIANKAKTYKRVPVFKRSARPTSSQAEIAGKPPLQSEPKKIPVDIEPNRAVWKPVGNTVKNIIKKVASSSAGRIASRVAGSGVVRAAGTAGMVMGAASDIMNISKATREVRKSIIHKPVEAIPRANTTNDQVANLQKAKAKKNIGKTVTPTYINKPMFANQADRNTAVGQQYGWGAKLPSKKQASSKSTGGSPVKIASMVANKHASSAPIRILKGTVIPFNSRQKDLLAKMAYTPLLPKRRVTPRRGMQVP